MKSTTNNIFGQDEDFEIELESGYELKTITTEELNAIDYKEEYDKITWSDNQIDLYNFYNYYSEPHKPRLRPVYVPQQAITNVSNETQLNTAISNQNDNIFITTNFTISTKKTIDFPCKISSDPTQKYGLLGNLASELITVNSDDVLFENLSLTNSSTSSVCNCISFSHPTAENNSVSDCIISTNEFGILSVNNQIQIFNNAFEFIGSADSHRYIYLNKITGTTLIYNNTFKSNNATTPNTAFMLINGLDEDFTGSLVVYNNSSIGSVQRIGIMEVAPQSLSLSFINNTIETNTDFFILYGSNVLNGITEIIAHNNTVTLIGTSAGFKGLIGYDSPSFGTINYCPPIRASSNTLPSNIRVDYTPLPNSSVNNPILCYKPSVFVVSISNVNINPPLVAYETVIESGGSSVSTINGPVVSDSLVFYSDTTGDNVKYVNNMKYDSDNNTLKVPDLETDYTLSLNSELLKIINITSATNITDFSGEIHVSKIKNAQHNVELEFDTINANLTADGNINLESTGVAGDIKLNSASITTSASSFTYNGDNVVAVATDNVNIGENAGVNLNLGTDNILLGLNAGSNMTDTYQNVAIGQSTLSGITNEYVLATAIGDLSQANTTGANNTSVGANSLRNNTTGLDNVAIGNNSQQGVLNSSNGSRNVSVGKDSLLSITTGEDNTIIGTKAGQYTTSGSRNVMVGNNTGSSTSTGNNNVHIGWGSKSQFPTTNSTTIGANSNATQDNQVVLGNSLVTEIVSNAQGTCNLGSSSYKFKDLHLSGTVNATDLSLTGTINATDLSLTGTSTATYYKEGTYSGSLIKNFPVGSNNTFSFFSTPPNLTATSDNNTFYGLYAGDNVTDSDNSTCIGVNAMRNSLSGGDRSENTLIGKNAGQGTTSSNFNNCTMLGSNTGQVLVTGNNNTFIGQGAGNDQTTGDNNTLIGKNATTQGGNKTNAIAIGWEATVLNDNQVCIGNGSIEKIYNEGNGTCDLGATTRQFKHLYMSGNIYGSYLPVVTRFRITKTPDRPPVTGTAIYDDNYIRLGWDQETQNDIQFQKATSAQYLSTCSVTGSTSVSVQSLTTSNTTYELNGALGFVGGQVMTIIISPTNIDTTRSYRIQAHYTETSTGTDDKIDFIVERFDRCDLV